MLMIYAVPAESCSSMHSEIQRLNQTIVAGGEDGMLKLQKVCRGLTLFLFVKQQIKCLATGTVR